MPDVRDLLPNYARAIAFARHIREDLDKEYKKNDVAYYRAAKESPYYHSLYSTEMSLQTEEAYHKALGMIEYSYAHQSDEQLMISINVLFQKGYRKMFNAFKRLPKDKPLKMSKVIQEELSSRVEQLSDDQIAGNLFAGYFFSHAWDEALIHDVDDCNRLVFQILTAYEKRKSADKLEYYNEEIQTNVRGYVKQLPKDWFEKIQIAQKENDSGYDTIFDMEELSSISIFAEMKFSRRDFEKIAIAYDSGRRFGIEEDFVTYAKYARYILALCKAYKNVKEYYFANNREDACVELDEMQTQLQEVRSALAEAQERRTLEQKAAAQTQQQLVAELAILKRKNEALQEELKKCEAEKEELYALREYIFSQESVSGADADAEETEVVKLAEDQLEELRSIQGIIVGGRPGWIKKIRAQLPNWQYISAGDANTVRNAALRKPDMVFFVTAHLSHKLYYAMVEQAQVWKVPMAYISRTNVNLALGEIYQLVENHM